MYCTNVAIRITQHCNLLKQLWNSVPQVYQNMEIPYSNIFDIVIRFAGPEAGPMILCRIIARYSNIWYSNNFDIVIRFCRPALYSTCLDIVILLIHPSAWRAPANETQHYGLLTSGGRILEFGAVNCTCIIRVPSTLPGRKKRALFS